MGKKRLGICVLLGVFVVLSTFTVCLADPSHLLVTRDFGGLLWKKTCNGTVCSSWTSISGRFASQPTLVWDDDTARYYLYGVDAGGNIWRSSFSRDGTHDNVWVVTGGASPSPLAGAGGGIINTFNARYTLDMTSIPLSSTISNITDVTAYAPVGGWFDVTATGTIEHYRTSSTGNVFARVYLTTTSGGTQVAWSFTDLPDGTPTGWTSFPFGTTRWFSVAAGTSTTFYLTGEEGGSAEATTTTGVLNACINAEFFPHAY